MKRSGFCVLLAALFLLSGCDGRSEPEKQAAGGSAAQSGSVGPAPYAETAPAYGPAEEDDNPYASYLDSGGMYLSWLYDVYGPTGARTVKRALRPEIGNGWSIILT